MARDLFDSTSRLALALVLCAAASGQAPLDGDVAAVSADARGLWADDDAGFRAGGTVYEAVFDRHGMQLTPALGPRAERDFPLRYRLASIRRGEARLVDVAPESAGLRRSGDFTLVRPCGPGVEERFDVLARGVEVSYRFEHRPPGRGSLVVTARLATELSPDRVGEVPGGVRFGRTVDGIDLGGVSIGAVTGIDALGRTVRGTVRYREGHVEFELPAAFVETAAYPLVLDPLIGPEVGVGSGVTDHAGDVAYSPRDDMYCFAWSVVFSTSNVGVRAQRMSASRTLIGSLISVTTGGGHRMNPSIGTASGRFLAAWQEGPSPLGPFDIRARAIQADGTMSAATIDVAATAASETEPDVACGNNEVLVVWNDQSGISIAEVTVPLGTANPSLAGAARTVSAEPTAAHPAISKGRSDGRHCVVFQRVRNGSLEVAARAVDRTGTPLGGAVFIASNTSVDERDPDVDGDGDRFAVVYARQQSGTAATHDIWCRPLRFDSGLGRIAADGPAVAVGAALDRDERTPAIGFAKLKYVVAWVREKSGLLESEIVVKAIEPITCAACGVEATIQGSRPHNSAPAIVTKFSAGHADDAGIISFLSSANTPPFSGQLRAQRFEAATGGPVVNLGGACGDGGTVDVVGEPAIGNAEFAIRLAGTAQAHTAVLNIGLPGRPLLCGTCEIMLALINVTAPKVAGAFSVPVPIPCDPAFDNVTLQLQWLTVGAPSKPCALLQLMGGGSDRVEMTIRY